jgi:hypothetical protein
MAICGFGLPACCCQPAVAGGFIYADLRGELNTHLALQALFTQSSPVCEPLLQAFPWGGDTAPAFSGLYVYLQLMWEVGLPPSPVEFSSHRHFYKLSCSCLLGGAAALASCPMFVYSSHGRWIFPPLLCSFPPSATLTSFPAPGYWVRTPAPARASLARPGLFIYSSRKDSPPPLFGPQGAPPSLQRVFIVLIAYYSVSLFSRVEISLSRGLCCSGPGLSLGVSHTAKLTLSTSSQAIRARATGSPGALLVSPFNVKWRFSAPAGGVEGQSFASSWWFCLQVVFPASLQDFII